MENVYFHSKHPSDEQLSEAAAFFSANYGVWGQSAVENMGPSMKIGEQICFFPFHEGSKAALSGSQK